MKAMNINEVEKLTGISKPNIRFYEKKGLIKPKRNKDNDYRDYSLDDINVLEKIKLFRLLSFSIDEISKMLKSGKLIDVENHIKELQDQIDSLNGSIKMCKRLKDEVSVTGLDTDSYLSEINELENKGEKFNSFNDDFRAFLTYKETRKFMVFPDNITLEEEDVTRALREYAKNHDYDIEFITESMQPKFYLNGLRYHAYAVTTNVRANYICCVCDEELVEPIISTSRKIMISLVYYLPIISLIILLICCSVASSLPNYVSFPLIAIFSAMLVASLVFWGINRKK